MSELSYRWYVYELVDPRTDVVFYVGKGTGDRINDHEREARRGVCSKKTNKINKIIAQKLEIIKRKVAYFCDEQVAYDFETEVIARYGLENLTNVMPGGQKAFERRMVIRQRRIEQPKPLIDWFTQNQNKAERVFEVFAEWFRLGMHLGGKQVHISVNDPKYAFHAKITEMGYNRILPTLWAAVCKCEKSLEQFALRMKPYGIEVSHGRP